MADVVPLQQHWPLLKKISEKHESTSPSAIQVKNQRTTVNIEGNET